MMVSDERRRDLRTILLALIACLHENENLSALLHSNVKR